MIFWHVHVADLSCRRRRNAQETSSLKHPSSFASTTYAIDDGVPSKSERPPAVLPQKTESSAGEYAEVRRGASSLGVNRKGDADDGHDFVDNEIYGRRGDSYSPGGSVAVYSTREQGAAEEEDADRSLTLVDNDVYGYKQVYTTGWLPEVEKTWRSVLPHQ